MNCIIAHTLGKLPPYFFHNIGSSCICGTDAPMISLVHICTNIAENKHKKSKTTTVTVHVYVTVDNTPPFLYSSCLNQSHHMHWPWHLPSSFSQG